MRCRFTCNWCDDASLRARLLRTFFKPADMELVVDGSYDILIAINQDSMLGRIPEYRPETTYCFTMEPAWSAALQFDSRSFKRIYTHVEGRWPNAVNIPTMLPYHLTESKEDLIQFQPIKSKRLSYVVSAQRGAGLYGFRLALALKLLKTPLDFDLYGYGWPSAADQRIKGPVDSKSSALTDYTYSICIENCRERNYVSEKIVDCFLTGTTPIYLGCPNIEEIYDRQSYHHLDATDPIGCVESILSGPARKDPYIGRAEFFQKYDLLRFIAEKLG